MEISLRSMHGFGADVIRSADTGVANPNVGAYCNKSDILKRRK